MNCLFFFLGWIYCKSTNDLLNKFSLIDQNYTSRGKKKNCALVLLLSKHDEQEERKKNQYPVVPTLLTLFNQLRMNLWNEKKVNLRRRKENERQNEMMSTLSVKF